MGKCRLRGDHGAQETTEYRYAATWLEYLKVINALGYVPDYAVEPDCRRGSNPRPVYKVVKSEWRLT